MTKERAIEIIKNFESLSMEYAKKGEVDTVANIQASIAAFVKQYEDVLR